MFAGTALAQVTLTSPNTAADYHRDDTVTIEWTTTNAAPSDNMIVSMKRASEGTLTEPDGVSWHRFAVNTPNDGTETVTIPDTAAFADAYVRRQKCLPENCSKKRLTVFLTDISKCSIYKIIMAFQSQPKEANDDQTEWQAFVNETYGCLADDPIERGEQGVYEIREAFE